MDAVVSKVVDVLRSIPEQELRVAGREVQTLTSYLPAIQRLLVDADARIRAEDEFVQLLIERVRDIVYEMDDVVDEWSYAILKSQIQTTRKVWLLIHLLAWFIPTIFLSRRFAVKIHELNARLDEIVSDNRSYWQGSVQGTNERPPTDSLIGVSGAKGREVEKARLVNLLLAESSELPRIHTVSIVGMGGIGKTTLAKLVYNDETVKSHFDVRMWACVSKPLDLTKVAGEILQSLVSHSVVPFSLQHMVVEIQRHIKGRKFLLVLDDVWNEDPKEWKVLEDCLSDCFSGSKILVTACNEQAAQLMKRSGTDVIRVGLLSKEECWSLFCEIAFNGWSSEERQHIETTGVEIVERCKGLPLAVNTLASLLHNKKSKEEWEDVLDSEFREIEDVQRNVLGRLCLSYSDLPSSLKQCFLYCAVFPKGYRMSANELISLWMAHGFLEQPNVGHMEMVGLDCFHDLSMRSLFQDFEVEEKFNGLYKNYCKMHEIVHDLARSRLMENESLSAQVKRAGDIRGGLGVGNNHAYHLCVKLGEKIKFPDSFCNLQKLRSLSVVPLENHSLIGASLPRIFDELTCLRSLSLSRCRLESIPSNINKLIHLRWLKLSKNYALKELPETICELYNLQTLSVNWCDGLIHFPKGVEKLIKLRHLKNDYTYVLLPKGIGKLSGLRKLSRVTIDPKFKDAFSLRDLENVNNIGGSLTIFFMERERGTLVEDSKQTKLQEKKHITAFSLNFPERAAEEWMQQEDEELVEALKPPLSLEMLRITCYAGANFPSWTYTLPSLKKLKLWYWGNCEHLPALAKLPCLEHVEFNGFRRVQKAAAEFLQIGDFVGPSSSTVPLFPKLKNLQFMNMIEWEEWSDYDGDEQVMPCLSYLRIENCPKLKKLPNFILEKANLFKQIIR